MAKLRCLEICAGGGGQALGLEWAGFEPLALVELDKQSCNTLRSNRPEWNVVEGDLTEFHATEYRGQVDLLAGGVPCPPFSKAGKQLGKADERNLFPEVIRLVDECRPKAVMIENVRGILDAVFEDFRNEVKDQLDVRKYHVDWKLFNASEFGVSQLRPRVVFVAIRKDLTDKVHWPVGEETSPKTVGELLYPLMASCGWKGAKKWREQANEIAPTIVGGSLKHGGPDLGPTRAKRAWASLGVDGHGVANEPPARDFVGMPKLTVEMVALLQGFPPEWKFSGRKTPAYRQVGNAFPPQVARAVAIKIKECLSARQSLRAVG